MTNPTALAAVCTIHVRYASGRGPTGYLDRITLDSTACIVVEIELGQLHMKRESGTVSAGCSYLGATPTRGFGFQIGWYDASMD
jgi:hypothetical protein